MKTKMKPSTKRKIFKAIILMISIIWLFVCAFPFYWSIITALKPNKEIMELSLFPKNPTLANFAGIFRHGDLAEGFITTISITIITMVLNITVSLLAGYSFARLKFKGKGVVFSIMVTSMMLPFSVVFIPTFIVLARFPLLGGNDIFGMGGYGLVGPETMYAGLILPSVISVYNIFFLKQFFLTLPNEMGESAIIDGANEFTVFYKMYLPLIAPAAATLALFTFQAGWNSYFWPNILSQGQIKVLTTVLRSYYTMAAADQAGGMAFTLVVTAPIIVVFLVFQKYFMSGLTAGSVKS